MENDLKIPAQYWAGNPLRGPARRVGGLFRGARRPIPRVGWQARLGCGLAARSSRGRGPSAPAAQSLRSRQRGGGTAIGPTAVSRRQDSPESTSGAPGCRRAGGAEVALTRTVGRWRGGGEVSGRRRSSVVRGLRWSPAWLRRSCSSGEARG
jgi:hypothetical protein